MTEDTPNEAVIAIRLRRKAVMAERAEIAKQARALQIQEYRLTQLQTSLEDALAKEEALLAEPDISEIPELHPTGGENLSDLLLAALKAGPKTLDQLKQIGLRWAPLQDSNFPGRALNFALVGLQKGGHVERLKEGQWKLISEEVRK